MSPTAWLLELSNTSYPYLKYSRLYGVDYGAVLLYVSQPDENNLIEAHAARILSKLQPTHFRDLDRLRRMVATRELRNEIVKLAKAKARTFGLRYGFHRGGAVPHGAGAGAASGNGGPVPHHSAGRAGAALPPLKGGQRAPGAGGAATGRASHDKPVFVDFPATAPSWLSDDFLRRLDELRKTAPSYMREVSAALAEFRQASNYFAQASAAIRYHDHITDDFVRQIDEIVRLEFGPGGEMTVEPGTKEETTTMARVVIKFHGFANDSEAGLAYRGWYLKSFDHEAHNGRGDAVFTPHIKQALSFPTMEMALAFYNTQSRIRPLRPDGEPNRPLTACHIELLYVTPARPGDLPEVGGGPA